MKKLVRPKPEVELDIYREFLVRLHTAMWTGNNKLVKDLLKRVGDYSYARTNTNGDWEQEEQNMIRTLLALQK